MIYNRKLKFFYRVAYLQLVESCVSEIILHKGGVHPNFEERFVFETPAREIIGQWIKWRKLNEKVFLEQLADSDVSKRLNGAIESKQIAVARQQQYWAKLEEFRAETEALRKHVREKGLRW